MDSSCIMCPALRPAYRAALNVVWPDSFSKARRIQEQPPAEPAPAAFLESGRANLAGLRSRVARAARFVPGGLWCAIRVNRMSKKYAGAKQTEDCSNCFNHLTHPNFSYC